MRANAFRFAGVLNLLGKAEREGGSMEGEVESESLVGGMAVER